LVDGGFLDAKAGKKRVDVGGISVHICVV
jgi:hypothetical protein